MGDGEKADSEEKEKKEDSMYISTYKVFFVWIYAENVCFVLKAIFKIN